MCAVISKFNRMGPVETEISWFYKDKSVSVMSWLITWRVAAMITGCVRVSVHMLFEKKVVHV